MPKIVNYRPDVGDDVLYNFYHQLDLMLGSSNSEDGGQLLGETIRSLQEIFKGRGKVNNQLGTWASQIDPYINSVREVESRLKSKQGQLVSNATYSNICKRLLFLTRTKKINQGTRTNWIVKFTDPDSNYYCSQFVKDLTAIDPILGNAVSVSHSRRKKFLLYVIQLTTKHPYLNKKTKKAIIDKAIKKYPLGVYRHSPLELFRTYCLPESERFDLKCFEEAFAIIGYKVDGTNPDNSIKELILRVLSSGSFIDNPNWHLFVDDKGNDIKVNQSLWFWFDRFTNKDSKYYDKKFDSLIRQKYPQQYDDKSLVFDSFRFRDAEKIKQLGLYEKDKTHKIPSLSAWLGSDTVFKQKYETLFYQHHGKKKFQNGKLEAEHNWNIKKKKILKLIKEEKIVKNTEMLMWLVKGTKDPNGYMYDDSFEKQVQKLDPVLLKHIRKEWSKDWPNRNYFIKAYEKEKYNIKDLFWFAIPPCDETLPYLDFENTKRTNNKCPVDPSFVVKVRRTKNFSRDNIRKLYFEKYLADCPWHGRYSWSIFKNKRSIPYTWNLKEFDFDYTVHSSDLSRKLGTHIELFVKARKSNIPFVPKQGKFAGYTVFQARIDPNKESILEYLNEKRKEK